MDETVDTERLAADGWAPLHVTEHAELWRDSHDPARLVVHLAGPAGNGEPLTPADALALLLNLATVVGLAGKIEDGDV